MFVGESCHSNPVKSTTCTMRHSSCAAFKQVMCVRVKHFARVHLRWFPMSCFLCCLSTHCLNKYKQRSIWDSYCASPRAESLIVKFLELFVEHHESAKLLLVLSLNGRNSFELVMFPHVDEPIFLFGKKLRVRCKTSLNTLHNSFERFAQHGPAEKWV